MGVVIEFIVYLHLQYSQINVVFMLRYFHKTLWLVYLCADLTEDHGVAKDVLPSQESESCMANIMDTDGTFMMVSQIIL